MSVAKRKSKISAPGRKADKVKENRRRTSANGGDQALRDSELSYRRLFESAQDGILILDVDTGRVNDVNPFLYNLLGLSKIEILGKTIGELSPFKDVVSNHAMLARLQKDYYVRYDNLPLEAKDGHRVQVEFVCNVYQAGDKKVIQCNIRDIAKRKASEQRLRAPYEREYIGKDGSRVPVLVGAAVLEDDPENGVCFLLDLNEQKKLEMQFLRAQRIESIGTLAGGIAHDLNNILAPIMMSIEVLKTFSENSPQTQKILTTIEVCARRGADIVRQVLSFSRGMDGARVEIQPKHLLHELSTIVRDTFPRDIRLEFSIPNDTWTILGDPTQVQQILLNLCVNARDAMPMGGILSIGAENCVLDEHYVAMNVQAKTGRYVNITVTDTGTGIPPSIIDKIYEPFFTTKEIDKSTGLGLSTVTAIVKSHEGLINVYSEVGKGTSFKVYLPAMGNPSGGRKGKSDDGKFPRGKGETVLVVDDEASILNITRQTLLAFGYRVLTAVNGADAVAVYAENKSKIAVVLSDTMMPIMGGKAMAHALRRINPTIKIIASSGLNANGSLADAGEAAPKDFLVKPYTAKALLLAVRRILDEE